MFYFNLVKAVEGLFEYFHDHEQEVVWFSKVIESLLLLKIYHSAVLLLIFVEVSILDVVEDEELAGSFFGLIEGFKRCRER
jgi:hypothetical protein